MRDVDFEWDDRKAAQNVAKHRVSFGMARHAFADPYSHERADESEDYGEDRMTLLGFANGRLLNVTFVCRGERVRIVSARGADPLDQRRYHEAQGKG